MPRTLRSTLRAIACTALATVSSGFGIAGAEDNMQTGDGLLMIKVDMPSQTRVGESFTYNVEITNASDNVVLHDVKLEQSKAKGFTIESVSMQGNSEDCEDCGDDDSKSKQGDQSKTQSTNDKQSDSDQSKSGSVSKDSMKIKQLNPGESRTFVINASADEEGELRSCLQIVSYTPAMCLISQVVKPELELTKTAPKTANRCNVIELTYKVKNGGSGDVGKVTVKDSLGDGLATIEGNSELSFSVDGLAAGETREFVARVYAQKPGEFRSRAVAKAENSELKGRSKQTTTKVIAADLTAKVNGPSRIYGNDMAEFTATITNTGNVAADSVNVSINWPSNANLADMSEYELLANESSDRSQGKKSKSQGEPTMANTQVSSRQTSNRSSDQIQMQSDSFVIDRLEAGQSAQFTYAIRTDNLNELPTKVVARYVCTVDAAEDQAKSTANATTMAMATAKVVRLPALQLAVIDDEDPVKNGSKVQYTINVWNEGDAPDQNVRLVAQLPGNLKFDSADGPTEAKNDGGKITFDPIKTMQPGDRAEFTVTAKPTGAGNARFEAALTSKMLQSEVVGEEPTRLFNSSSN